ncbi:peptidoglycan-binding domain-containing protein [Clostridium gasigenes]|uniref:peptidoglycan-binding domain-containing protein n=1 Tax=Clostridium gasigenes TaxID=94869 RepID=UPI001C0B694D|nr:peptidoglycan-binding domain-containing protein [Clostridium gasigenes]MBU3106706.1 peptidoglycan-binding protein [Clostridium gasigenes]
MNKKLIILMLATSLTLGCSVQAFATTNTVTKMPVNASEEVYGFNYNPNGGPSASSIIANGGVIQIGDVGQAVKDVQKSLAQRGILSEKDVDGYFGQNTKTAVENYQRSLQRANINVSVDGIVGRATWSWMRMVG